MHRYYVCLIYEGEIVKSVQKPDIKGQGSRVEIERTLVKEPTTNVATRVYKGRPHTASQVNTALDKVFFFLGAHMSTYHDLSDRHMHSFMAAGSCFCTAYSSQHWL